MTIDHVGISVPRAQYKDILAFYVAALAPLGYKVHMEPVPGVAGLGKDTPDWWITASDAAVVGNVHVAFSTMSHADVDKFHELALAAGAKDNGAPGLRAHYHPNYYGAFVIDPAGNNVEVVCHCPEAK